ncbi:hypothetical protein [Prevotella koreensis]|uniref:hypothetical protein n=1 Tax=Prevotella koreensis TaxID=2490854 RepID=UPI0028EFC154|nr:hypothetical protein [Prevotella koreensis]
MKHVSIVMKYTGYVPEDTCLEELREYAEGRIDDFFRYYDENNDEEYDFDRNNVEITDKGLTIILG